MTLVHSSTDGFHETPKFHPQRLSDGTMPWMYASTEKVLPIGSSLDGQTIVLPVVCPCGTRLIDNAGAWTVIDALLMAVAALKPLGGSSELSATVAPAIVIALVP